MRQMLFIFLISVFAVHAQGPVPFESNSDYYARGNQTVTFQMAPPMEKYNALGYKNLPYRTAAVDPKQILPGSVLFVPALIGKKLPDGSYHDGYLFAHDVVHGKSNGIIVYGAPDKTLKNKAVYVVYGVMAKTMRLRFALQYKKTRQKMTYQMVADDLTRLMKNNKDIMNINQRIQFYSARGKGTPYLIFNLGEGANAATDPDPTIDFSHVDCMTFCENTLALSISDNYKQMYNNLQRIRYRKGDIRYTSRNHYTIADWLPNNSWLLDDATKQIGGKFSKKMTKIIDHYAFFKKNHVPDSTLVKSPPETLTVDYIPTNALLKVQDRLKGGEIVSIVSTLPGIISAHMGIVVRDRWNNLIFRHASSSQKTGEVMDIRFSDYVQTLKKSKTRVGMIFMRADEQAIGHKD